MPVALAADAMLDRRLQADAQVVRQISMLGGFLGRKGDSEPGVKTLWLGMQRLRDFIKGMAHMQAI